MRHFLSLIKNTMDLNTTKILKNDTNIQMIFYFNLYNGFVFFYIFLSKYD